mmetsp:Transcript_11094/g.28020  ORF Transcript_11094/g.28020 Transcript_11094/m.28020 type:complete len:375 (-) Transcript_11094:64-1188(-)
MRPLPVRLVAALVLLSAATSCRLPASPVLRSASAIVIDWPQTAITSREADRSLVELVARRHFGYNALSDKGRARLGADLERSQLPACTLDQAVCVRNLLYKLQLDSQRKSLAPADMMTHYYTVASGSLSACTAHFQTAPLEVVRDIVRHRYRLTSFLSRKAVELLVTFVGEDPHATSELAAFQSYLMQAMDDRRNTAHSKREMRRFARNLEAADWEQFVWACQHDMQGRPKQLTMNDAVAVERLLEEHLRSCGAQFRTERDLRRDQDEQRRSTPDILFDEGSRVCLGRQGVVRWIDMKNMYGTVSCGPVSDALVEQLAAKAVRYTADWGPGAFVLKYGFCEALSEKLQALMGHDAGLVSLLSADSLPVQTQSDT